jgi:malate dehydrogenase (oxaloacetate-decarboxylating)(NADP+)
MELLHDPALNKGTAFSPREREVLGLRGLLPPGVQSQENQVARVLENLRSRATDLDRYVYLTSLQDRNETLFYRVVMEHLGEVMPIIYTPTVGRACQEYGHIFRRPRGLYVSRDDRGQVADVLRNWPEADVRVIVVTDGERILGLGDLGASGMGIPIGKLALYTACAGVPPQQCLPVTLDVGTGNEALLNDPLYIGIREPRLRGEAYDALVGEFVEATQTVFPRPLVQFEDFANRNAFRLLEKYRERICTFDDDIQGTGSVALAGLLSALRVTGLPLVDQRVVFLGAGEAGVGIADTLVAALVEAGLPTPEARRRCWLLDSRGLVVASREDLAAHKRPYAHDHEFLPDLHAALEALRPTALVGVSGVPGTFDRPVVEAMARINDRPVIFALSNPTSKSECTAEQAFAWSGGRALFASGSPFDPFEVEGRTLVPSQGNNAYIFPGVGLGVICCEATRVTDEMFPVAARALAEQVSDDELAEGRLYPALERVREVSAAIAAAVAGCAWERGLARSPRPQDPAAFVRERMYQARYRSYV